MAKSKKSTKKSASRPTTHTAAKTPRKATAKTGASNHRKTAVLPDNASVGAEPSSPVPQLTPQPTPSSAKGESPAAETRETPQSSTAVPNEPGAGTASVATYVEPADSRDVADASSTPSTPAATPSEEARVSLPDKHEPEEVTPAVTAIPQTAQRPSAPKSLSGPPVRHRKRRWILAPLLLVVVASAGVLVWHNHFRQTPSRQEKVNKQLVAEVAERAVLPGGETPSVTTVVNKEKVSQTFLADARNGDKVLLFFQAGKAVLYRPSTHQVVNIGPLQQPDARVFIRSGTPKDVSDILSNKLSKAAGFKIVSKDFSDKRDYTKTLVVDLSGNRPDLAERVATVVGGTVSKLPPAESPPDADILVIAGADSK